MESATRCWWACAFALPSAVPVTWPGLMIPSFMARNRSSSSSGRPSRVRKTCEGKGTENSRAKSTSPLSMKRSIRSLTRTATSPSIIVMRRGAKIGSSSLRYFLCSGGSICRGISGRAFFRSTAVMLDVKVSGWRRASSMSTLRLRSTPVPSMARTGLSSRSALNTAWGLAAMSAPIPRGPSSRTASALVSSDMSVPVIVSPPCRSYGGCVASCADLPSGCGRRSPRPPGAAVCR